MTENTMETFKQTLDALIGSNAHARNKGNDFKQWCKQHFGCDARISHIKEQKQITNRVSEQFRYFAPIVVFVCVPEVKRDKLKKYIIERVYNGLENVAIIGVSIDDVGNSVYTFEELLVFKKSAFTDWAQTSFAKVETMPNQADSLTNNEEEFKAEVIFRTGVQSGYFRNRILFGAPGTGKSFTLNREKEQLLANGGEYERVTFHPDYSYANFVGSYKPVMVESRSFSELDEDTKKVISILTDKSKTAQEKYNLLFDTFKDGDSTRLPILLGIYTDEDFEKRKLDGSPRAKDKVEKNHGKAIRQYINLITENDNTGDIAYKYVPGPFMRTYVKALKNARTANPKPYLLIIEEINRANVAAVFGDVFQLLDRNDDSVSEYPIQASEDIKKYLANELGGKPDDYSEIRLPDNMFIWATMNSADQGVFPMDTAFKRRWDFTYIGIDESEADIKDKKVILGTGDNSRLVEWNELRKAINEELLAYKINEDKLLGPYFISKKALSREDGVDVKEFCRIFKNKVIMYLFDDAAKQKRATLFSGCEEQSRNQYSKICLEFDTKGVNIFCESIRNKFTDKPEEPTE